MKKCTTCKELKSLSEFSKDKRMKDGLQSHCKECGNKQSKQWNEDNPERRKYHNYKKSAKQRGKDFNLTFSEFTSLLNKDCLYCDEAGGGIDRFNNSIGYQLSNCVPCCGMCNIMKLNHSYDNWLEKIEKILIKDSNMKGVF